MKELPCWIKTATSLTPQQWPNRCHASKDMACLFLTSSYQKQSEPVTNTFGLSFLISSMNISVHFSHIATHYRLHITLCYTLQKPSNQQKNSYSNNCTELLAQRNLSFKHFLRLCSFQKQRDLVLDVGLP